VNRPIIPRLPDQRIDVAALTQRVPAVQSRLLIELVSDIRGVQAMTAQQRRDTRFFPRLLAQVTGRERKERLHATAALARSQASTLAWVNELAARSAASDLALRQCAVEIRSLQYELHDAKGLTEQVRAEVSGLSGLVSELATVVGDEIARQERRIDQHEWRLDHHESRIELLEGRLESHDVVLRAVAQELTAQHDFLSHLRLRQHAWEAFSRSLARYRNGAYRDLPWPYQITLFAGEVTAGPCGLHEHLSGDRVHREWLIEAILDDPAATSPWVGGRPLDGVLAEACEALPDEEDRQMVAELLAGGSPCGLSAVARPLFATLVRTVAYAAGEDAAPPAQAARRALAEARAEGGGLLETTMTPPEFVHRIIDEQADAGVEARERLAEKS
jgi:hypothetical protein